MSLPYTSLVGPIPSPLTFAFRRWYFALLDKRLEFEDATRASIYYFDNVAGDDSTGEGTLAAPWKTIAKAQAVHDDPGDGSDPLITHGGSDFALLFKRGVEWQVLTGLDITKANVTIGAYGTGDRPHFNRFTVQYPASGGAWTLVSGTHYKLSNANNIAWVRDRARILEAPTRCVSSAEVDADDFSYWYDTTGDELHVNFGVDPDTLNIEAVIENDEDGVFINNADAWIVKDIYFSGWGIRLTGTIANQNCGFKANVNGTNGGAFVRCGSYYGSTHAAETYATVAGGFVTVVDCDLGYTVPSAAGEKVFAAYNQAGGMECITHNMYYRRGSLPSTTYGTPRGGALISHSGGDSFNQALLIFWGNRFEDHEHSCRDCGGVDNTAFATSLSDVRCFFVDEEFTTTAQTGYDPFFRGVARINPKIRIAVTDPLAVGAMYQGRAGGWCINGLIRLDLSLITTTPASNNNNGFYNSTSADNRPHLYASHVEIVGTGIQRFGIDRDNFLFSHNNQSPNGEMISTIYSGDGLDKLMVALNNLAANQHHNVYYNVTDNANNQQGYNRDPYKIVPNDMPLFGDCPSPASEFFQAGDPALGLEYDAYWNPRNKSAPTVGPRELWNGLVGGGTQGGMIRKVRR